MSKGTLLDPGSGGMLADTKHLEEERPARTSIIMCRCPKCRIGYLMKTGLQRTVGFDAHYMHKGSRKTCQFEVIVANKIYPRVETYPLENNDDRKEDCEDERDVPSDAGGEDGRAAHQGTGPDSGAGPQDHDSVGAA